jgi:hypothetical protein
MKCYWLLAIVLMLAGCAAKQAQFDFDKGHCYMLAHNNDEVNHCLARLGWKPSGGRTIFGYP